MKKKSTKNDNNDRLVVIACGQRMFSRPQEFVYQTAKMRTIKVGLILVSFLKILNRVNKIPKLTASKAI
jgi:hypothetical protein